MRKSERAAKTQKEKRKKMKHFAMSMLLLAAAGLAGLNCRAEENETNDGRTVMKEAEGRGGWLFTHFQRVNEGRTDVEKIQFSLSRDLKSWKVLNGGKPVLTSDVGTRGLRDPFPFRKKDGTFVILATDLNTSVPGFSWDKATNAGSPDIILFESKDLVHWSKGRAVSPLKDATAAWAPKIVDDAGTPLVLWSCKRKGAPFRIYGAHTEDFVHYGEPFVFAERGDTHVIDTIVVPCGGAFVRFVKDDVAKAVMMERADSLRGPWTPVEGWNLGDLRNVEGPACTLSGNGREAYLLLDHYARGNESGYREFRTDDLLSGRFEPVGREFKAIHGIAHGGMLRISEEEYRRLEGCDWK